MLREYLLYGVIAFLVVVLLGGTCMKYAASEHLINYSPDVMADVDKLRCRNKEYCYNPELEGPSPAQALKQTEAAFCLPNNNPCYAPRGPRPGFPLNDVGGGKCVAPFSNYCQKRSKKYPASYYPCREGMQNMEEKDTEEGFLDWTLYNPPIINGFYPQGSQYQYTNLAQQNSMDRIYNPLRYPYRSEAFYEQGWYPNMILPPQVIGCGGRRQGCLGGTQEGIPVIPPPIEISERNIAPVNIMTRGPLGVPQQLGVLYKIFGSLNDVLPLFGRRRYPNSDTWDYYTMAGPTDGKVKMKVVTKKRNHNELGTNDTAMVEGNSARYRVTIYERDMPMYVPYA